MSVVDRIMALEDEALKGSLLSLYNIVRLCGGSGESFTEYLDKIENI
jgi:hypothetical protein